MSSVVHAFFTDLEFTMSRHPVSATRYRLDKFLCSYPLAGDIDESEVLRALKADGVSTIEQLVSRTYARMRDGRPSPSVVVGADAIERSLPAEHTPPQIAVTIDGVEYEPADITRFNGTPLHFVAYRLRDGIPRLQATTDRTQLDLIRLVGLFSRPLDFPTGETPPFGPPGQPNPGGAGPGGYPWVSGGNGGANGSSGANGSGSDDEEPAGPPYTGYSIQMFSDVNYGGDWFWLGAGWDWPRLSKVSRNTVLFFSGDWNDEISSLAGTGGTVTYFENANYQGSSITIPPNTWVPDLRVYGFNDRISSVRYPPFV